MKIKQPFLKQLGWLVLMWTISVASLGLVSMCIRFLMNSAGLVS